MKQNIKTPSPHHSTLHSEPLAKTCTCPQCGQRLKHVPGVPCVDRICPLCGVPLKSK